ncbi:MAG: hypothetical protein AAGF11_21090 [Myxococcota bacterium]
MRTWVVGVSCLLLVTAAGAVAHAEPAPAEPTAAEPAPAEPAPAEPSAAQGTAPSDAQNKAPVVSDGPVAVTTRLSPDPSNVGDLLVFEVVAAYPRDVRVNLPTRLNFEPLHHVRTEEGEPEPTGDGLRKTFRIELQHFEVGTAQIPSFPLTYVDAEGGIHTVQLPARSFTVESLLVNEDDPQRRGEDPPISREYPDTLAETVIWSVLGTLLLALAGWLAFRRLWGRERPVVLPPPIPPHEVAFEALDELERGELLEQGEVQRYYVELTEIAKGYIQGRFGVLALDRTTDEIRHSLLRDAHRLAPLSADEVVEFLQQCDLVKFARWKPPKDESHEALGHVRQMVRSSMASPEGEKADNIQEADNAQAGDNAQGSQEEGEPPSEAEASAEAEPEGEPASSSEPQPQQPDQGAQP